MEGGVQWRAAPEPSAYAKMFSGKYQHRTITDGEHKLP